MVIAHNILGMNAQRQYGLVTSDKSKNTEKLSSGYKINRAADDAAGLTISEKMRSQIRGLRQASDNSEDGISFIQIADGALTEVHDMLDRMVELTVKASNGTETDTDRDAIQKEIQQLRQEIDRVHSSTEFNTIHIFPDAGHSPDDVDDNKLIASASVKAGNLSYTFDFVDNTGSKTDADPKVSGVENVFTDQNYIDYADFVVKAAADAVGKISTKYPKLIAGGSSQNIEIGLNINGMDGTGGTLASAGLSMRATSGWTQMTYSLNIDKADYNPATFSKMSDAKKADFAATIAHEMTHLVMFDTLTPGMLGSGASAFPQWFIEGMAQTSSGDGGWVSNNINAGSSDTDIKNYISKIDSNVYGAGYLGTMALGYEIAKAANPSATCDSATIAAGLDKLFDNMTNQMAASNGTLNPDEAISAATGGKYSSFSNFTNRFASGESGLLDDVKDILAARGTSGAGSLLGNLNTPEGTQFAPGALSPTGTNYKINKTNKSVTNSYGGGYPIPEPIKSEGNGDDIILQVGAAMGQEIALMRFNMTADSIFGYKEVNCSTQERAKQSIAVVNNAISRVSKVRSYYGAMQNRLEHTIKNLDNVVENTQAAESLIRDTDMAAEMVKLTKNNILMQAGESMIAQANQSKQGVLSLLQ